MSNKKKTDETAPADAELESLEAKLKECEAQLVPTVGAAEGGETKAVDPATILALINVFRGLIEFIRNRNKS